MFGLVAFLIALMAFLWGSVGLPMISANSQKPERALLNGYAITWKCFWAFVGLGTILSGIGAIMFKQLLASL